jgi:hypothetical protein
MLKKYEVILTMVFMGIFAGIYLYVHGSISRDASITIFGIGILSLSSFITSDNDLERYLCVLQDNEMQ